MNQEAFINHLKALSLSQWEDYLQKEPEWRYPLALLKRYPDDAFICFMVMAGLNDYQLKGPAETHYWPKLVKLMLQRPTPKTPAQLIECLKPFYQKERFYNTKIKRLHQFLQSKLADWLWQADKRKIASQFGDIWQQLAQTMHQRPYQKTIVFAMKCLYISLRMLGEKVIFSDLPIPVDSRIKKISTELGFIENKSRLKEADIKTLQQAWQEVLKEIQKDLPQVTIFHLDSYLWQMAGGR